MITQLVYMRLMFKREDGTRKERNIYMRCSVEQIPLLKTNEFLVYFNVCNNTYIRNDEYECSRFPEGSEL